MYRCSSCGYHSHELEAICDPDTLECFSCGGQDIQGIDIDAYFEERRESYEHEKADDERKYGGD